MFIMLILYQLIMLLQALLNIWSILYNQVWHSILQQVICIINALQCCYTFADIDIEILQMQQRDCLYIQLVDEISKANNTDMLCC